MTVGISGQLIGHVRKILDESLIDSLSGKAARHGTNAATLHGLSTYILAAASIEDSVGVAAVHPSSREAASDPRKAGAGMMGSCHGRLLLRII